MGTCGSLCGEEMRESRDGQVVFGIGSECGGRWRGGVSGWWVDYVEWGRAGPRGLD